MAKKIEMTKEELKLYNEVKKEVKKANQRILRLERLTGIEKPFAVKQLSDYLDTFAITGKGRVTVKKSMDLKQIGIVQKAVKDFLKSEFSSVKGAKAYKNVLETELRENINFKQANIMYNARQHWSWIYDYFPGSEFFAVFVWPARRNNWSRELWIERLGQAISSKDNKIADEELRNDLIDLYRYFVEEYTE